MLSAFGRVLKTADLRRKLLFTLGMFVRISIAQGLSFLVVAVWYLLASRRGSLPAAGIEGAPASHPQP